MDPRKKWMNVKSNNKTRRYRPATATRSNPDTEIYDTPDYENLEYRIQQLIRRRREARERNDIFMDELNEIIDLNRQHGAHNRQSRMNRGTQIAQQIRQNDELIIRLQNEVDEINDDFDDVSSVPRR